MKIVIESIVIKAEGREACLAAMEMVGRILHEQIDRHFPEPKSPKRKRKPRPQSITIDASHVAEIKAPE